MTLVTFSPASTPTEKSSSTTEIASSTCAVFGVVVAAAVGYIVRRRSWCKFFFQQFSSYSFSSYLQYRLSVVKSRDIIKAFPQVKMIVHAFATCLT